MWTAIPSSFQMLIKTTRGLRNIRYRDLHQKTQNFEVITFNPQSETSPRGTDNIPHFAQYAPLPDVDRSPLPSFSNDSQVTDHPLHLRPSSSVSNSSTIANTTFPDSELRGVSPIETSPSPSLVTIQLPNREPTTIYPGSKHSGMSAIDHIVTQIDSLLRRSNLNKVPSAQDQTAPQIHQEYRLPDSNRGLDLVSRPATWPS